MAMLMGRNLPHRGYARPDPGQANLNEPERKRSASAQVGHSILAPQRVESDP
jgi:hypothetical protein